MSYRVVREVTYPTWEPYEGNYEILVGNFKGPPEQVLPVSIGSWIIQQYEQLFGDHGEVLMHIKVEADWSPTFWTNYRITAKCHDNIPQLLLAAIVAALIIVGLALLAWQISNAWKALGEAAPKIGLGILLGCAGAFLVLVAMSQYNKTA